MRLLSRTIGYTTCRVCGWRQLRCDTTAWRASGPADLDTRPAKPARHALLRSIRQCRQCGHCAPDLSELSLAAPSVIRTPDYSAMLESSSIPRWARRWACCSMIQSAAGSLGAAGWSNVRAAWDCDDHRLEEHARDFRMQAAAFFQRARLTSLRFAPSDAEEAAVLADLLRRTERFSEAMRIASTHSSKNGTIRAVLSLQHRLAERGDVSRHTIRDALVPVTAEQ